MTWLTNNVQSFTKQLEEYYAQYFESVKTSYDEPLDKVIVNFKNRSLRATYSGKTSNSVEKTAQDFENEIFSDVLAAKTLSIFQEQTTNIAVDVNLANNELLLGLDGVAKAFKVDEFYSQDTAILDIGKIFKTANMLQNLVSIDNSGLDSLKLKIEKFHFKKS